jgi:hypothetical protein
MRSHDRRYSCYRLSGAGMVRVSPKSVWQSVSGQLRRPSRSTTLLIIWVAGFIDVVLLGSFAMGPRVHREVVTPSKLQHRLAAVASNTIRPIQISNFPLRSKPSTPQTDFSRQRDAALTPRLVPRSETAPQPDPATNPPSESLSGSDSQPVSVLDSNSALQAGASPQSNTVPLPTRKPETPTLKRPSTKKASLKRTIMRRPEEGHRPPMQFGNFGYNYVGQ